MKCYEEVAPEQESRGTDEQVYHRGSFHKESDFHNCEVASSPLQAEASHWRVKQHAKADAGNQCQENSNKLNNKSSDPEAEQGDESGISHRQTKCSKGEGLKKDCYKSGRHSLIYYVFLG